MKTIIYYKVNFYQKKLREDVLKQLVLKDGLHPTEVKYFFDKDEEEANTQYVVTKSGTFQIYGENMLLCQGKTLVKSALEIDENNPPDIFMDKNIGTQEWFKVLDKITHKETILKICFQKLSVMPRNAVTLTCYYYKDYLKCIPHSWHLSFYSWTVYYQRNKRDCYNISYDWQECTWKIGKRFVAKDQTPLSPDEICERVYNYVCLMGEIMSNLHNRKYERRDPEYKPSEDTFVAKAAKAGISTRTLYKRRKEIGSDDLTAEQLKPRRRGKKPKNNNEDKKD